MFVFQQPVSVCLETNGSDPTEKDWPRIELEVRWIDGHGRGDLGGYGCVHIPMSPGTHELSCHVWRPRGTALDRFAAFFVGGNPQLQNTELRFGVKEEAEGVSGGSITRLVRGYGRQRLSSEPSGVVHLRIGVCTKQDEATAQ